MRSEQRNKNSAPSVIKSEGCGSRTLIGFLLSVGVVAAALVAATLILTTALTEETKADEPEPQQSHCARGCDIKRAW